MKRWEVLLRVLFDLADRARFVCYTMTAWEHTWCGPNWLDEAERNKTAPRFGLKLERHWHAAGRRENNHWRKSDQPQGRALLWSTVVEVEWGNFVYCSMVNYECRERGCIGCDAAHAGTQAVWKVRAEIKSVEMRLMRLCVVWMKVVALPFPNCERKDHVTLRKLPQGGRFELSYRLDSSKHTGWSGH